jgi:hypothetical protein
MFTVEGWTAEKAAALTEVRAAAPRDAAPRPAARNHAMIARVPIER